MAACAVDTDCAVEPVVASRLKVDNDAGAEGEVILPVI